MAYMLMRVHAFICDRCESDFEDLGTKRFVWSECRERGWVEIDGKHFCPKCQD